MTVGGQETSLFFRSAGLRLHARRHPGRGRRPIVVVPGITTPAGGFASLARAIAELPDVASVDVLDMRGRGLSERAGAGRHRAADYAEDVLALVDAAGLDRPLLVGHSLGARVVAAARAALPGYSCGVLAIEPVLSGPGGRPYPTPLSHFIEELRGARQGKALETARERFPTWSEEELAQRARWIPTCDELAVIEGFAWFHLEAFEPFWAAVDPPAVLLAGDHSPAVTAEDIPALTAANPRAAVRVVERSGHMVPWDNLAACLEAISELVRDSRDEVTS